MAPVSAQAPADEHVQWHLGACLQQLGRVDEALAVAQHMRVVRLRRECGHTAAQARQDVTALQEHVVAADPKLAR